MNAAELKSRAPLLPADVAISVSRAVLHVHGAAVILGVNTQSPDLPAVLVGCASFLASHLIQQTNNTSKTASENVLPIHNRNGYDD